MERRVLLAIFLSFLVLYVWQALFVPPSAEPAPPAPAPSCAATAAGSARRTRPAAAAGPAPPMKPAPLRRRRRSSARRRERDVRVETARRRRRVHESRRPAQELAAEALSRSTQGSRRSSSRTISAMRSRCRSRCACRTTQRRGTLNDALYTVTGAPARRGRSRRRPICGSSTATAPACMRVKKFQLDPASYCVTFKHDGRAGRSAADARHRVGPGSRRRDRGAGPATVKPRGRLFAIADKVTRLTRGRRREAADARGRFPVTPASTITTS